jgi:hypothetical protein
MTLRRLRELREPEALRLLAWSLLTTLVAECLLRTTSLTSLLQRFGGGALAAPSHEDASAPLNVRSLHRVRRYTDFIAKSLLRSRRPCLLRCLVLYRYCRKRGVPAAVHFGVRTEGGDDLKGHSWISLHGTPLFEAEEDLRAYACVYAYPDNERGSDPALVQAFAEGRS